MEDNFSAWILVVDDDIQNLKVASRILGDNGIKVSCLASGSDAVNFLASNKPDLVLLDVHMPEMDGFETLRKILEKPDTAKIPVILLTADEDGETEAKGFAAGAKDFIRKPFVPEVLKLRTQHIIELERFKSGQAKGSAEGTADSSLVQMARIISKTMGAKDSYLEAHSARVAAYAREIAKRAGYDEAGQEKIYIIGLLYDIGMTGVPDHVLCKRGRFTDDEYMMMERHTRLGADILKDITGFPELAAAAAMHHERFDGKGYPERLSGTDIPEYVRIITVADAYDAMRSDRPYRSQMTQAEVREQFEEAGGKQFDPRFAEILLQMIDTE